MDSPVILFDGVCNLCNSSVQWIIRRDGRARFRFASLQSSYAQNLPLLQGLVLPDSLVLIADGKVYVKSSAALRIAGLLGFPWLLLKGGLIIPRFIRDAVYDFIARNRYRWFGKQEFCMMPSPELKSRFIDG